MNASDAQAPPEQLIAELNRRRNLKLWGALGGLVVALGALFAAALLMYSDDPTEGLQPTTLQPAALQPAANQPAANQPAANQPAANQPAADQPAADQPAAKQPTPSVAER